MDALLKKPTKETVRQYMQQRQAEPAPLPSAEEIRRRLGWGLVQAAQERGLKT